MIPLVAAIALVLSIEHGAVADGPIPFSLRDGGARGTDPISWLVELNRPLSPGRAFFQFPNPHSSETVVDNTLAITAPPGYTLLEGSNPQEIYDMPGQLPFPGTPGIGWSLRAPCNQDPAQLSFELNGTATGGPITSSMTYDIQPVITPVPDDDVVFSSWAEQTFSFSIDATRWALVRADTAVGPVDLALDDDMCIGSPYETSAEPIREPDIIALYGPSLGDATHYALILPTDGSVATRHEFAIQQRFATERPIGVAFEESITAYYALRGYAFPAVAGRLYTVAAAADHPSDTFSLAGFESDRASAAVGEADFATAEPASAHQLQYLARSTGSLLLVMSGGIGTFGFGSADLTFLVTEEIPVFADGFESGDTSAWSATVP